MTSCAISPNALRLVLSGAEGPLQIVLGSTQVLHAEAIHCPGTSVTVLAPMVERILAAHSLRATDLAGIAVVRGPGSFTGLRICLASAAGLGFGAKIPMAGLELHSLLAAQAPHVPTLWVATAARSGAVYAQSFSHGQPCGPIHVLSHEELRGRVAEPPSHVLGSGVRGLDLPSGTTLLPDLYDTPWPATLLAAARNASFSFTPPSPLYLRRSDAEENLPSIAARRGIPEAEARKHIPSF